jgi:hypothetical protein
VFRCQICGQVAAAGTRATKVVVVSREKVYASRGGDPDGFRGRNSRFRAPSKPKDKGGKGAEIVQELMACQACAAKQVTHVVQAKPEPTPAPAEVTDAATPETEEVAETEAVETEAVETEAVETEAVETEEVETEEVAETEAVETEEAAETKETAGE